MARTPEGRVKDAIKAYLKSLGDCCWWFMPIGGAFTTHGVPDFIVCYKGVFLAIEAKRPGNEEGVTALQQLQINGINMAGGLAIVASGVEAVQEMIGRIDAVGAVG